jgi:hypothetical protein
MQYEAHQVTASSAVLVGLSHPIIATGRHRAYSDMMWLKQRFSHPCPEHGRTRMAPNSMAKNKAEAQLGPIQLAALAKSFPQRRAPLYARQ